MADYRVLNADNVSGYIGGLHTMTEGVSDAAPLAGYESKRDFLKPEDEYNLRVLHGRTTGLDFDDRALMQEILQAKTDWDPQWDDALIQFDDIQGAALKPQRLLYLNQNPFEASPEEIKMLIEIAQGKRDHEIPPENSSKVKSFAKATLQSLKISIEQLDGNALLTLLTGVPPDEELKRQVSFPMQQGLFCARDWNNRLISKFGSIQNGKMLTTDEDGHPGTVEMLGFASLDEFRIFIKDKPVIVDLGSAANYFAKSLHLIGANNIVIPINPVKRFLRTENQVIDLSRNLNISRKSTQRAREQLRDIDRKTLEQDWNHLDLAEGSVDLLISVDAFPKFCVTTEEAKAVLEKIYKALKPGGTVILSPLYEKNDDTMRKNAPVDKDNFRAILEEQNLFEKIDIKHLDAPCFDTKEGKFYRVIMHKPK